MTEDEVNLLDDIITAYYNLHAAGGSFHVVLDDGNWDRASVEFCLKRAEEDSDHVGVAIGRMLIQIPDEALTEGREHGTGYGLQKWKEIIRRVDEPKPYRRLHR